MAASAYGYAITTSIAINSHLDNSNLSYDEKILMIDYELVVAAGGIALTYAIVNFWNPTGWGVAAALGISLLYTYATMNIGSNLTSHFENN